MLEERFPGEYVLIVTADHGQCPLPDAEGGVRLDPIQLDEHISANFAGVTGVVQEVTPHEVYLNTARLWDNGGATVDDIAASLQDYRYRQNLGSYVPADAIEQDLLDRKEFAAVFASTFMDSIAEAGPVGAGRDRLPRRRRDGRPRTAVIAVSSPSQTTAETASVSSSDPFLQMRSLVADRGGWPVAGVHLGPGGMHQELLADRVMMTSKSP